MTDDNRVTKLRPLGDIVAERLWRTRAGYHGLCLLTPMGTRNGYVAVPAKHPLFGAGLYDDDVGLPDDVRSSCHGGVTWADDNVGAVEVPSGMFWWIGFDCAHPGRGDAIPGLPDWPSPYATRGTVRTMEFVVSHVESLAEAISLYA